MSPLLYFPSLLPQSLVMASFLPLLFADANGERKGAVLHRVFRLCVHSTVSFLLPRAICHRPCPPQSLRCESVAACRRRQGTGIHRTKYLQVFSQLHVAIGKLRQTNIYETLSCCANQDGARLDCNSVSTPLVNVQPSELSCTEALRKASRDASRRTNHHTQRRVGLGIVSLSQWHS